MKTLKNIIIGSGILLITSALLAQTNCSWNEAIAKTPAYPDIICKTIKKNVRYTADVAPEDEWRNGQETFERKKGDCEDIALAVKELCLEKEIKSELYMLKSEIDNKSHVIIIGSEGLDLWMSSNGSYKKINSISDAKDQVSREMGWWSNQVTITKISPENYKKFNIPSVNIKS